MAAFPTPDVDINAPYPHLGSGDKKTIGIIKNSFEANYMQVRRTTTRQRKVFELVYDNITLAEFAILEVHFDVNVGTIFTFTHPVEQIAYQVTYAQGELEKTYVSFGIVSTKITLESI